MKTWLASELREIFGPKREARFALDLTEDSVTLIERRKTGATPIGSVEHADEDIDDKIAELRAHVEAAYGDVAPVDLLLPDSVVGEYEDTFPAEDAKKDLREAVWWRLDTMTQFRPEDLFFDVVLRREDPETGYVELGVAVAPKDMVEEAIDYAKRWRFAPQRVTSSRALDFFADGPTFAIVDEIGDAAGSLRRSAAALAAAAAILAIIGVMRGVGEREALADAAETRLTQAETQLEEAAAIRAAALEIAELAQAPSERRARQPLAVERLGALAKILPPSASASRVVIGDGVVRIEGAAENPDAVLAAIETAPEFETARYAADVAPYRASLQTFAIEATVVDWEAPR